MEPEIKCVVGDAVFYKVKRQVATRPPAEPRGSELRFPDEDTLEVTLRDGRTLLLPIAWYPPLMDASPEVKAHWQWIGEGTGVCWPDLDYDLSIRGMLV